MMEAFVVPHFVAGPPVNFRSHFGSSQLWLDCLPPSGPGDCTWTCRSALAFQEGLLAWLAPAGGACLALTSIHSYTGQVCRGRLRQALVCPGGDVQPWENGLRSSKGKGKGKGQAKPKGASQGAPPPAPTTQASSEGPARRRPNLKPNEEQATPTLIEIKCQKCQAQLDQPRGLQVLRNTLSQAIGCLQHTQPLQPVARLPGTVPGKSCADAAAGSRPASQSVLALDKDGLSKPQAALETIIGTLPDDKERPELFGRMVPSWVLPPWKLWGTCITHLWGKVLRDCPKSSHTFIVLSAAMSSGPNGMTYPPRCVMPGCTTCQAAHQPKGFRAKERGYDVYHGVLPQHFLTVFSTGVYNNVWDAPHQVLGAPARGQAVALNLTHLVYTLPHAAGARYARGMTDFAII